MQPEPDSYIEKVTGKPRERELETTNAEKSKISQETCGETDRGETDRDSAKGNLTSDILQLY